MKHLQLGWVESMTEDGEIYYFNVMTNESLWDLPAFLKVTSTPPTRPLPSPLSCIRLCIAPVMPLVAFLKVTSTQYQHDLRRYHGNASHYSPFFTLLCLLLLLLLLCLTPHNRLNAYSWSSPWSGASGHGDGDGRELAVAAAAVAGAVLPVALPAQAGGDPRLPLFRSNGTRSFIDHPPQLLYVM